MHTTKLTDSFLRYLPKLSPVEFLGLMKILNVDPYIKKPTKDDPSYETKDATELINEVIAKYDKLPRKPKRELNKIMREVAHAPAQPADFNVNNEEAGAQAN